MQVYTAVVVFSIFCSNLILSSFGELTSTDDLDSFKKYSRAETQIERNEKSSKECEEQSHSVWDFKEPTCKNYNKKSSALKQTLVDQMVNDIHLLINKAKDELANPSDYPSNYSPVDSEEFDFIVVGSGSAGAVVANRLTEVEGWRVLLLEAGGDPTKISEIPTLFMTLQSTEIDWQYRTELEENLYLGIENNTCIWPRGKVLGGSSTINYMKYVRGNAKDYDAWAAAGNLGWSYNDVLPYFKKSEDLRASEVLATEDAKKFHGTKGYLQVESFVHSDDSLDDFMKAYEKAMAELGHPFNPDCNGKNQTGFTKLQENIRDGRRCSTAKAFLSSIKSRRNLKVTKNALVIKVLIDKGSATAYGVEFVDDQGKTVQVRCKKEVILSAGAINSPQLLMLSGIGPRQHLVDLGLPVIQDLPVGQNFQDHPLLLGLVMTFNYSVPPSSVLSLHSMFDFLMNRPSNYSFTGTFSYASFINTLKTTDYPDIELYQNHFEKNQSENIANFLKMFRFKENIIREFVKINEQAYTVVLLASLLRPYSRGKILLKSSNPKMHPMMFSGYLSDSRDIDTYLRTYDFVSRLVQTKALKPMDAKLHEVRIPDCDIHPLQSPEYRECSMRHLTTTSHHQSSSCKMGPSLDPEAVVDPALRVHGVKGLRVVDASIMPTIVSGNPHAPIIMIAEKASDLIKEQWNA